MAAHPGGLTAVAPSGTAAPDVVNPAGKPSSGASGAVSVRDLIRSFGPKGVLNGVDLDIAPGEFVALLGPSGCGKSTLLRALAGLDHDVRGSGIINVPERVSVVFQDSRLLPWDTVLGNVTLGLREHDAETGHARPSPRWDSPAARSPGRTSCPAANSSAWRWPGRWSVSRSCCWRMNRSAPSMP
jgi:sulfonate transport system ATP-binding protein